MVPHYYNYDLMKHINVIRRTDPAISFINVIRRTDPAISL